MDEMTGEEKQKIVEIAQTMSDQEMLNVLMEMKDREVKLLNLYSEDEQFRSISRTFIASIIRATSMLNSDEPESPKSEESSV